MLPNAKSLKDKIQALIERRIHHESRRRCGPFAECPVHIIHEGGRMVTHRADGSVEQSDLIKASAEATIIQKKRGTLSNSERAELIEEVTNSLANQMSSHFFSSLGIGLEKAGQVVDAKGLSPVEAFFRAIDRMEVDFDENGEVKDLIIACGPEFESEVKRAIDTDPLLAKRFEDLKTKKREEWRAREATRKLD